MTIARAFLFALTAVSLLLGGGALAHAADDSPSARAERGLFGSPNPRHPDQNASVEATLRESYDDNILADQVGTGADPRTQLGGMFSSLDTVVSYDRHRDSRALSLQVSSTARYYPGFDRVHLGAQSGRLESGQPLWRGARLTLRGDASYSPRLGDDLGRPAAAPHLFAPGAYDNSMPWALEYSRAGVAGEIQQSVGEHSALSLTSQLRVSQVERQPGLLRSVGTGASLLHQYGRHSAWRASYSVQQADNGPSSRWISQDAALGIDRKVELSASRQAFYSFSAGTTILHDGRQPPSYRVMADARAMYDFGRRWNGGVVYRRGVGFVDPVPDPLLFDSLACELTGFPTRWLQWFSSGSFQRGGVGLSEPSSGYDMYAGRTNLSVSLSRTVALYGEYVLYQYQFGEAVRLPIGLGRILARQGVSVGLRLHTFF